MIHLHVSYKCGTKENRDSFYENIKDLGAICRTENGNHKYAYFFPAADETQLFLWEIWDNQECLDAHTKTDHFKKIGEIKTAMNVETDIARVDSAE